MKRRLLLLFMALILLLPCAGCGRGGTGKSVPEAPSINEGERPAAYTEALLQSGALLDGVRVADGYIMPGRLGEGYIQKLDLRGRLLWKKRYPFQHRGSSQYLYVHEDNGGDGFFVVYDVSTHQVGTKWVDFPPVLARMDTDGSLLWHREYPGKSDGTLQYVFALPSGEIVTAGNNENDREPGVSGPSDLYLSKLSAQGELLLEKTIKHLDAFAYVHMAACIPGHGIFVFNGFNSHHLALVDENLEILWDQIPGYDFVLAAAVLGETVFLNYAGNSTEAPRPSRLRTMDMRGEAREIPGLPDDTELIGTVGDTMAVTGANGVCLLDETGAAVLELPVPDWADSPHGYDTGNMRIAGALRAQDGYIVVYEKIGDFKPTPAAVNHMPHFMETVYAGYDAQGQLLWQYGYEH